MNFVQAINSGIKHAFNFSGRASRSEYWYYEMFCSLVLALVFQAWFLRGVQAPIVVMVVSCFLVFSVVSARVRRLHDTNRPGVLALVTFMPIIGLFLLLVWGATPGTAGDNQYGPDPLLKS